MSACTEACRTPVNCAVCGLRKPPRGRSVAMEAASGMCNPECDGYMKAPVPGHLWPGEELEGNPTERTPDGGAAKESI